MAREVDRDRLELRATKMAASLKRSFAGPTDIYSYWDTLYEAQQYAQSSPLAYVGQILIVANTDVVGGSPTTYQIANTSGALEPAGVPIASTTTLGVIRPDGTSVQVDANGVLSATGGGSVTVDDQLSTTSTNPVQNRVITNELNVMKTKEMKVQVDGTKLIFYKQ